jgi:lecithin-cholesterol acyltransferase
MPRVKLGPRKEVIVKRLPSWSVLRFFVLSVAISGLPTTGIAQTRTPLVLVPGYISTKLLVTVENQTVAPDCPASGTFGSWFLSDQSNGFSHACRDKLMTLVYNRQPSVPMSQRFSEQPGVTVTIQDYGTIESCPCPYYEDLYALLEANGYTRNLDIRVAGYDWRLTPDMGGFLQRTIGLIEQTYADNGNTPVHLLAHSNGPLYAHYLLTHTSQAWKNKFIHGFTSIAGNLPGSGLMYSWLFTGFNISDVSYPVDAVSAKVSALMFQSHPATYMSISDPAVFKNQEVIVQAGSAIYTPQHYRKLFRDAGLLLAEELGAYYIGFVKFRNPAFFPNVDAYAEKGSGLDTPVGISLPDLTVGQLVDDTTEFFFLPGDSSEEYITTDSVVAWEKMDCFRFELNDNPGVDHVGLATAPAVMARLLTNLQRPRSVCPGH